MASLTLRKALRIKKQIEASIKPSASVPQVSIDIDDDRSVEDIVKGEERKYLEAVERQIRLSSALSEIRSKIEASNANGVNAVMSRIGHIDRQIAAYKPIAAAKPVQLELAAKKVVRKREAAKTPKTNVYGYDEEDSTTLQVGPLSEATITEYKARIVALRKEREELEEKRLVLNNTENLSIEIGDDTLSFLTELEIV